jgi:hypothetical protein
MLENCIRSIELLSPRTDVVVFDDRSDDPMTLKVLGETADRGHEVVTTEMRSRSTRGNLYPNLQRALELAHARGHRLLHLVQDDSQFMWYSADLEHRVKTVFDAFPAAAQIGVLFWKRATRKQAIPLRDHGVYRAYAHMAATCVIGFVDVPRVVAAGFRFGSDEADSRRIGAELGLEEYALAFPVVSRIPWPVYARHGHMRGRGIDTNAPLLLKPLDEEAIARLTTRDIGQYPNAEDYCEPWGWRCWSPYAWTSSHSAWLRGLLSVAWHRRSIRGLVPRRVGQSA